MIEWIVYGAIYHYVLCRYVLYFMTKEAFSRFYSIQYVRVSSSRSKRF